MSALFFFKKWGSRPRLTHQHLVIFRGLWALKCRKLLMSADLCANSGKLDITWGNHLFLFFIFISKITENMQDLIRAV